MIYQDDVVTEISPNLFVSGFIGAIQYKKEYPEIRLLDVRGLIVFPTPTIEAADACALLIHLWHEHKEDVLVHCQAGAERSPFVCAYYLSKYNGMSYNSAWQIVASRRACAIPTIRLPYTPKGA